MNLVRAIRPIAALFVASAVFGAWSDEPEGDAQRKGREIARQLLGQRPTRNAAVSGTIKIRPKKGDIREIPFRSSVVVEEDGWKSVYETEDAAGKPATRLTIRHTANVVPGFFIQTADDGGAFGELRKLEWKEVFEPFVGSDFRIIDLAYPRSDHLTWPTQRLLRTDIRRGQSCHELESVNPHPEQGGFARVVSWIDIDTGGPLEITGYDQEDDDVLEFSPKRFRKVNGEFKVTELHIRNGKTGSRTILRFDFGE